MKSGEQFRLKIFDSLNKANHVQSDTEIFYIIDGVLARTEQVCSAMAGASIKNSKNR